MTPRVLKTLIGSGAIVVALGYATASCAQDRWAPWRAFHYGDEMATAVSVAPGAYPTAASDEEPPRLVWILNVPAHPGRGESESFYTESRLQIQCSSQTFNSLGHADFDARGRKLSEFPGIAGYWITPEGVTRDVVRWICNGAKVNELGPAADTSTAFLSMYRRHLRRAPSGL